MSLPLSDASSVQYRARKQADVPPVSRLLARAVRPVAERL